MFAVRESTDVLTLGELAAAAREGGLEAIRELIGDEPVYVVRMERDDADSALFNTPTRGMPMPQTARWDPARMSETASGDSFLAWTGFHADSPVVPVAKSGRNPFLGLITIGRALNNDLRIGSPRVSKLHAFIKQGPDGWKVQDSCSSNGTYVDGLRLEPKKDVSLRFGVELRFADVTGMFVDLPSLHALCRIVPM